MPYLTLEKSHEAIDDPQSEYYNQIVNANDFKIKDWNSSEKMLECLPYYNLGIVVEHNTQPAIPGAGSCIFIHVWKTSTEGTGGCTAMAESDLATILEWLDPKMNPILVQYPKG